MRLTSWQKFTIRLKMRYKLKREYFTLVVPAVIAVVFLVYAIHSGLLVPSAFGTGLAPAASSSSALTPAKLAQELQTNSSGIVSAKPTSLNTEKRNIDIVIVAVPLIALAPYSIDVSRSERRARRYQEDFAAFLFELSELVRGGIDPVKAFRSLAEGNVGSITKFCQTAAKQMQIGYSFEEAMRNLGKLIDNNLVKNYIDLVIQASYSGGSVSGLIQRAASDMNTFISIDKEKRAGLSQ